MKLTRFWISLFLLLPLSSVVNAANILYWVDFSSGTDFWVPAFAARGDTVTTATSSADLITQLASGPWDVVVISENGDDESSTWVTPIANYVGSGGRVIVNNWYNNGSLDAATQTSVVDTNQTSATINATGIAVGLAAGVSANPITLTNAGWGTFSQSMSLAPASGAQSLCDFPTGSCAVLGNSGRTLRLGFIPDSLPAADGARFLQNVLGIVTRPAVAAPRTTVAVPTLSEWSMGLLIVLISWATLRRRQRS